MVERAGARKKDEGLGEEEGEDKCLWCKECEKDEGEGRRRRGGQIVVEKEYIQDVRVRKGEEERTNVCGRVDT